MHTQLPLKRRALSVFHFSSASASVITLALVILLTIATVAGAAIVPTVQLGTAANYSVLGGSTVTNTGNSVLNRSLGLSPGTSITGFPPGIIVPPATTDRTNAAAALAQSALTAAYVDAANRPVNGNTTANLGGLILVGGVYSQLAKGALGLTGTLTLDGQGDPNSVFIFQTNSTLTTASASVVSLINGAQACNVFWQVGSSATLGTSSVFVGNILALTSITVTNGVRVEGRALARNGAVTLDNDTFIAPSCATSIPTTTTTTTAASVVAYDVVPTSTVPGVTTTTAPGAAGTTAAPGGDGTTGGGGTPSGGTPASGTPTSGTPSGGAPGTPTFRVSSPGPLPELPFTGIPVAGSALVAAFVGTLGIVCLRSAAAIRSR